MHTTSLEKLTGSSNHRVHATDVFLQLSLLTADVRVVLPLRGTGLVFFLVIFQRQRGVSKGGRSKEAESPLNENSDSSASCPLSWLWTTIIVGTRSTEHTTADAPGPLSQHDTNTDEIVFLQANSVVQCCACPHQWSASRCQRQKNAANKWCSMHVVCRTISPALLCHSLETRTSPLKISACIHPCANT